jgi:hypothetical protein
VSEIRDVNETVHSVIRPGFMTRNVDRGITLIEVALVLGVSALILGLVLQGQSLIASSRVRWIMTFGEKVQTASFAFQDRYRVMPGDYANATQSIRGVSFNGNGNGRIEVNSGATGAPLTPFESLLAWNHLSQAGFLAESYTFVCRHRVRLQLRRPCLCGRHRCPAQPQDWKLHPCGGAAGSGSQTG